VCGSARCVESTARRWNVATPRVAVCAGFNVLASVVGCLLCEGSERDYVIYFQFDPSPSLDNHRGDSNDSRATRSHGGDHYQHWPTHHHQPPCHADSTSLPCCAPRSDNSVYQHPTSASHPPHNHLHSPSPTCSTNREQTILTLPRVSGVRTSTRISHLTDVLPLLLHLADLYLCIPFFALHRRRITAPSVLENSRDPTTTSYRSYLLPDHSGRSTVEDSFGEEVASP
jgi:hypothetical protein